MDDAGDAGRELYSRVRHGGGGGSVFELVCYIVLLVCMVLSCIIKCYQEEYEAANCEKAWDDAEAGAKMAVVSGRTTPFEIGKNLREADGRRAIAQKGPGLEPHHESEMQTYVAMQDKQHSDDERRKDREGQLQQRPDASIPSAQPQMMNPISGDFRISALDPAGRRRRIELNLRFVKGSGGQYHGIFGHGTHIVGRRADSQILNGMYNAATGLAVWIELVDYEKACELHDGHPDHIPRGYTQTATGRTSDTISSHMTVLSHGRFSFGSNIAFEGWYYAQVRSGKDHYKEQRGTYETFRKCEANGNDALV